MQEEKILAQVTGCACSQPQVVLTCHSQQYQGVVTPMYAILRAASRNCDPVYDECRRGLP